VQSDCDASYSPPTHKYFQNTLLQLHQFGVGLEPRVSRVCAGPLTRRERSGYVFPTGRAVINVMNRSYTPIPTVDLCDGQKSRSAHSNRSSDCKNQRRSVYDERFGVHFSTRQGALFFRITAHQPGINLGWTDETDDSSSAEPLLAYLST